MSAQTHETAGRILIEVDAAVEGRHHYETAMGLDPGRTQLIHSDLARLDALQGNWTSAERRIATLLADPDRAVAQVGAIVQARLAIWRRDETRLMEAAEFLSSRAGGDPAAMMRMFTKARETGALDEAQWQEQLARYEDRARPHRFQVVSLQRLVEFALLLDHRTHALHALRVASDMGLIDIVWLENCPLLTTLHDEADFKAVRTDVAARAARVLAAFRSTAG